jgi:hypothetical protein
MLQERDLLYDYSKGIAASVLWRSPATARQLTAAVQLRVAMRVP